MNDIISRKLDEEKMDTKNNFIHFRTKSPETRVCRKELDMVTDRFLMFANRLGSQG